MGVETGQDEGVCFRESTAQSFAGCFFEADGSSFTALPSVNPGGTRGSEFENRRCPCLLALCCSSAIPRREVRWPGKKSPGPPEAT